MRASAQSPLHLGCVSTQVALCLGGQDAPGLLKRPVSVAVFKAEAVNGAGDDKKRTTPKKPL